MSIQATGASDPQPQATPARRSLVSSQLEEGIALARAGENPAAREVFRRIIHTSPDSEDAWLWLAWVAESQEKSLRYLEEAQALLPDSPRIADALRWAKEQMGASLEPATRIETAAEPMKETFADDKPSGADKVASGALHAAQAVRQSAEQMIEHIKEGAAAARWPRLALERWSGVTVPFMSGLAALAMIGFVLMGITHARDTSQRVEALVLPTPALDATATPTVKQLTQPLWVQVDVAWTRQEWETAIELLQRIRDVDPHNETARKRLAEAYYGHSIKLIQANRLEEAGAELDQAIRLDATDENLQKVRGEIKLYLNGVEAYWMRDWKRVVDNLRRVHRVNPNFRDTHVMLAQAYYELGVERQTSEVWDEARDAYKAALDLLPEMPDARKRLAQVMDVIIPPKRIEVDLSEQRATLYENHKPVHIFSICTGRSTAPTLPGRYQTLDKLPMAYASKWDLNMPWWVGIYWAGGSENGFHALPILSNGSILWRGNLGRPCSFGCIVLDTPDAKLLYDWADIGTAVIVSR